jgi:ABC-type Fe3+ transport system substrate-binding protein
MQVLMADFFMADQLTSQVILKKLNFTQKLLKVEDQQIMSELVLLSADSTITAHGIYSVLLHGWKL